MGELENEANSGFWASVSAGCGGGAGAGGGGVGGVFHFVPDELGFDAAEAAHEADGVNDGVEGVTLVGGDGLVMAVVFVAEGFDESGILSREDEGFGFDAGLEGIEAGAGFALGGGGSGGLLGIEAVGLDLSDGCHGNDLTRNKKAPRRRPGG